MVTTKTLRLDVTKKYTEPIYLVQYEVDARILDIYLSAGSLPINLTGASVVFYAKKPDGTILFNNCTVVDAVSGHVVYTVTEQMCAVAGDLRCWILVIKDDAELRSIEFKVTVQPSEDDTEAIESTSEFTALDTALSTVASIVNDIDALQNDMNNIKLGYVAAPSGLTYEYVSATSFKVSGDQRAIFRKNKKIKWTQNDTVRYSDIISAPTYDPGTNKTTVTIHAGYVSTPGDCAVLTTPANPITAVYLSDNRPDDFPCWFYYDGAPTGFSSAPTYISRFQINCGACLFVHRETSAGTSNSTSFQVPIPVAAKTETGMVWFAYGTATDNGTILSVPSQIAISSGATTATILKTIDGAPWTASGAKRISFTITYEV